MHSTRQAAPALSILLNAMFVFDCIFSKPKTLELLKEEEEWPLWAVGSLLLQIQMFIRSTKHRYNVSWKGEGGRHAASSEMKCTAELFLSCKLYDKFHSKKKTSNIIPEKMIS